MSRARSARLALALCALLCAPVLASADSQPEWVFRSGVPLPGAETAVEMTEEWVRFRNLRQEGSGWVVDVEAEFLLTNLGAEAERVEMSFPLCEMFPDYDCRFAGGEGTAVLMDGAPIPFTTPMPVARTKDEEWEYQYLNLHFEAGFPAGKARRLIVRYTAQENTDHYKDNAWVVAFDYVLHTGARWRNPIGKGSIIAYPPYRSEPHNVMFSHGEVGRFDLSADPAPLPAKYDKDSATYTFEQLEPIERDDLGVIFLLPSANERIADTRPFTLVDADRLDFAAAASLALQELPDAVEAFDVVAAKRFPKLPATERGVLWRAFRELSRAIAQDREGWCGRVAEANIDLAFAMHLEKNGGRKNVTDALYTCAWRDRGCDPPGTPCAAPPGALRATWLACLKSEVGLDDEECAALVEEAFARLRQDDTPLEARMVCVTGLPPSALKPVLHALGQVPDGGQPEVTDLEQWLRPAFDAYFKDVSTLVSDADAAAARDRCVADMHARASQHRARVDAGTSAAPPAPPPQALPVAEPAVVEEPGPPLHLIVPGVLVLLAILAFAAARRRPEK